MSKRRTDRTQPELLQRFARKLPHCWEAEICWALFFCPYMHKIMGKGLWNCKWNFPVSTPARCKRNKTEIKIPWHFLSHVISSRHVKWWDQWVEHTAQLVSQARAGCTQRLPVKGSSRMRRSFLLENMPDFSIFMLASNRPIPAWLQPFPWSSIWSVSPIRSLLKRSLGSKVTVLSITVLIFKC